MDLVTGEGLDEALAGVGRIIDAATGNSPDRAEATQFFTAASHNLQDAGVRAGVERMVVVSIIGTDRFSDGYNGAKAEHERLALAGPIPVRILRAAQFHEFVAQLVDCVRLAARRRQGTRFRMPRAITTNRTPRCPARAGGLRPRTARARPRSDFS